MHTCGDDHRTAAQGRLLATLGLTAMLMLAEFMGGLWSGSLALLADAGHMLTDVLALVVAFAALTLATRPADDRRTYGYLRLEILAALGNGIALVVLSVSIIREATERWLTPRNVDYRLMAGIAAIGLMANVLGLILLRGHRANLNLRGAFLHLLGDTLSSLAVIAAAAVMMLTGWTRVDAMVSVGIALIIIVTSLSLLRDVVEVLLEAAPRGIQTEQVRQTIGAVAGVEGVHDLHVWSITSGKPALSAHVVISDPDVDRDQVLSRIYDRLREAHAIDHCTLQIERQIYDTCGCCRPTDSSIS